MAEKISPNNLQQLIQDELSRILESGEIPHGIEKDIVQQFKESTECGHFEDRIPLTANCICIYEQSLKYGRADIVIYHTDGSVSVIEAKDGAKGYTHTVSGIGQATLYAVQIGMSKGAVKKVRKCLLWAGTGNNDLDVMIDIACEQAGVISLPAEPVKITMACRKATCNVMERTKKKELNNDK